MNDIPDNIQIIIVGSGPIGLMTANLLGLYGVNTLLIEKNEGLYKLPRAILLDDEGCRTLQAVGLDRAYLPYALPSNGARYYGEDGNPFAEVGPGPVEFGFPRRTAIFQPLFEKTLLDGLNRFDHVKVCFSTELESFSQNSVYVTVTVRGPNNEKKNIVTSYLLGADGARSKVRQDLRIEMKGDSYPEDWLILDTLNDPDTEPVSKFFCSSNKPYVSVPAPNGGRRYEFRAKPDEKTSDLLDLKNILNRLKPIRKIHKKDVLRAAVYTFEAKIAEKWQDKRVFLLGDAAHVTPPFAGQGMNAGLRDSHNLSWKLSLAVKGKCGNKLLSTYEEERRNPAWAMIQLAVAMGDIIMPQGESDIAFRTSLLQWMKRFPAARDFITSMKFKPPPRYERGAFVNLNSQTFSGSLVGQMLPQSPVCYLNGSKVRLDDIIGSNFSILVQDELLIGLVNEIKKQLWPELAIKIIAIGYNLVDSSDGVVRLNPIQDSTLMKIRSHRDQALLIRPDRYVAASFDRSNLQDTIKTFQEFLL